MHLMGLRRILPKHPWLPGALQGFRRGPRYCLPGYRKDGRAGVALPWVTELQDTVDMGPDWKYGIEECRHEIRHWLVILMTDYPNVTWKTCLRIYLRYFQNLIVRVSRKGDEMGLPSSEIYSLKVDDFDTAQLLTNASRQRAERGLNDVFIVDADSHHYNRALPELLDYVRPCNAPAFVFGAGSGEEVTRFSILGWLSGCRRATREPRPAKRRPPTADTVMSSWLTSEWTPWVSTLRFCFPRR